MLIILYEIIVLVLYYSFNINKKFLSWPIFIILVVICCDCDKSLYEKIRICLVKLFLLVWLLTIVKVSFMDYIISAMVLIVYCLLSDVNRVYDCAIKSSDVIISFIISSFIYVCIWYYQNKN